MVAPLPLAKVGLLVLKRLTKPLASLLKKEAKKHPRFRNTIIIPVGKVCSWVEQKASSDALKGSGPWQFKAISDNEAVELGADAVGEIIIIGLLTVILFAEYSRQGEIKATARRTRDKEVVDLQDAVSELIVDMDNLKKAVVDIKARLKLEPIISDLDCEPLTENSRTDVEWDYY